MANGGADENTKPNSVSALAVTTIGDDGSPISSRTITEYVLPLSKIQRSEVVQISPFIFVISQSLLSFASLVPSTCDILEFSASNPASAPTVV